MFKTTSSKKVYANPWLTLYEDAIEFENGVAGTYSYVERGDGVCVAVLNERDEILLLQQYRYPIRALSWELPAGKIDDGETPLEAVIREVREESGLVIETAEEMGWFYPLNSCTTEKGYNFIARVSGQNLESADVSMQDEAIVDKRFVSLDAALEMIAAGEITDLLTVNLIQMVVRRS